MWNTILSILFPIFEYILRRYAHDEQQKKDYIAFLEIMGRKGINAALNRLSAQEQIDAVNAAWKKETDAQNPPPAQ